MPRRSGSQDLDNHLRQQAEQARATTPATAPARNLYEYLRSRKAELAAAVPRHLTAERLLRIAWTAIRRNPQLMQCEWSTVADAVLQCAQLGLEPGVLNRAHLVPYRNRSTGRLECQLIIGYQGYIDLVMRTGLYRTVYACAVRLGDQFDYVQTADGPQLRHVPRLVDDNGLPIRDLAPIVCCYGVAIPQAGGPAHVRVVPIAEIEAHRRRSRAAEEGPWITDYEAMALKTTIRILVKQLPITTESAIALSGAERIELGEQMDIDVDTEDVPSETPENEQQDSQAEASPTAPSDPPGLFGGERNA